MVDEHVEKRELDLSDGLHATLKIFGSQQFVVQVTG